MRLRTAQSEGHDRREPNGLRTSLSRELLTLALVLLLVHQPTLTVAATLRPAQSAHTHGSSWTFPAAGMQHFAGALIQLGDGLRSVWSAISSSKVAAEPKVVREAEPVAPAVPPAPASITDAAVSRRRPTLNTGRIDGSLRVFTGEAFNVNGGFQLTSDLYVAGSPNILTNGGASHGGTVNDGGSASPSGYQIILNGAKLPGKIHTRADALPLPVDIPVSVPAPTGTRTVNINSSADTATIGDWKTVRDLNVNKANLSIDVPPGSYGTFTLNAASRLNFTAGTYNFAGTVNLNGGTSIQATGVVTVNVGQNLNVNGGSLGAGAYTAPGDIRLNVLGATLNLNGVSQVNALVRAPNATVTLNGSAQVRGQVVANYLNVNGGSISGAVWPVTSGDAATVFGPRRFDRTTGQPNSYTEQFSLPAGAFAPCRLHLQNGAAGGADRISSADVGLNGAAVFGPSDFNQNVATLDRDVTLAATNRLDVTVRSSPGSYLVITISCGTSQPDTTPPTVRITSPADNSTTTATVLNVSGTAADTGAGASGVTAVFVNNAPATFDSAAGTWTLADVQLALGTNRIVARAVDGAGNQQTAEINVTRQEPPRDTVPPVLNITSPADNSTTQAESISVSGTVSDAGTPASGVAQVTVNGAPASLGAPGTWSISNVSLVLGANTINVRAVDNAGNASTKSVNVTRQEPPDTTLPLLNINAPADNTTTQEASVAVSGTASDPGQNASGLAHVYVNGSEVNFDSAGNWAVPNFPLNLGQNTITAMAVDRANNKVTRDVTVTRQQPPDTQPPLIQITSPADGSVSPGAELTVTGTATDEGQYATGVRQVLVNGRPADYDAATHQWTVTGVALEEGQNTIRAVAFDGAATPNRAEVSISVTRRTPDTQAPVVNIVTPQAGTETYSPTVNVTGTATDDGLNASGVRQVSVNGRPATYDANTHQWTAPDVPLSFGDNTITVVALDGAPTPNQGQASVHVTRLRLAPPTLSITNPANGAVLSASSITVAGTVSTDSPDPVAVTVNGQPAAISGGRFTRTVELAEGSNVIVVAATDSQAQQAQASVSVVRDQTPPAIAISNAPAYVEPGGSYQVTVEATDNVGVADVELRVNGASAGVVTVVPYRFTVNVPAALAAGNVLTLTAIARDLSGSTGVATAKMQTTGPGGVSGYVFDDSNGYVLEGVAALVNGSASNASDAGGAFNFVSSTPSGVVRLSKVGFTPVERVYTVSPGEGTALFDARLTPLDAQANAVGPTGGTATGDGGRLRISFDAGLFTNGADVRVTSVSPQGLEGLLPFGWSPVPGAVLDVRAATAGAPLPDAFQSPARLNITRTPELSSAVQLVLARYDENAHGWVVVRTNINADADGALDADLQGPGQYAFLVADAGAGAPPAPVAGQPLPSGQPAESAALDGATASAVASPRTAGYTAEARSTISFIADSAARLPSGVSVEVTYDETYNLLGGKDALLVDRPAQDIVLYSYPASSAERPNRLGAFFVAKPTRTEFTVTELLNANVHVEIRSGRQARLGTLVGGDGGELRAGSGASLLIPSGALAGPQPLFFGDIEPEVAGLQLPEGYEILAAFELELTGATLGRAAVLSLPSVAGDLARVVVARVITVAGRRSPKLVARAVEENGKLVSTTNAPQGVTLGGITTSGRYLLIRVAEPFGYVKGVARDGATGGAAGAVRVSVDRTPFVDLTGSDGRYVILGSAGANQVGAAAVTTDATGHGAVMLAAQDSVADLQLTLTTTPLSVESVTPSNGAANMVVTTPVTVTFNKPVAPSSVTPSSFKLTTVAGNPVPGAITVLAGSRVAVLTPATNLNGATSYRVNVTQAVRDLYGKPLAGGHTSTFSTSAAVRTDARLNAEKIKIDYPDASGLARVRIAAHAVPEGSAVLAVNDASGATSSTVAGTTDLELTIQAQVGDPITFIVRQPDGTEYRVTQAAYRRADGFISVGARGGTVTSDDGQIVLVVPPEAITGVAHIKMALKGEADIPAALAGQIDAEQAAFGGGIEIKTEGQFVNTKELHLELPAPPGAVEGQTLAFMKPAKVTIDGVERDVWETVTSGRVEGGRLKSTSPPFIGLILLAVILPALIFIFIPKRVYAVHGIVTERIPGAISKPLYGVVCTIATPGPPGQPPYVRVATTGRDGRFGLLDFRFQDDVEVQVVARDYLRQRAQAAVASPRFNSNPLTEPGLIGLTSKFASIEFPSSQEDPRLQPALLRFESQTLVVDNGQLQPLPSNQRDPLKEFGLIPVGSYAHVAVEANPVVEAFSGQLFVNGVEGKKLVWEQDSRDPRLWTTVFEVTAEGGYGIFVETYTRRGLDTSRATASLNFVGLRNPNTRPPLEGPPSVISVTPPDNATQVDAASRVHLEFSEPVKNLKPGDNLYLVDVQSGAKLGGKLTSGGLPVEPTTTNISSLDFAPVPGLEGGKQYELHVTTDVVDSDGHHLTQQQSPGAPPTEFKSTFKTFAGLVLTDTGTPDPRSYRIAAAGQYAATVYNPGPGGSFMNVYDMSDPQQPAVLSTTFVPQRAIGIAMSEANPDVPEESYRVAANGNIYSRIAVITTHALPDLTRATNLQIWSLDDAAKPEMIGIVSLSFPNAVTSIPGFVTIHRKRAYIGTITHGGCQVVDIERAINEWFLAKKLARGRALQDPLVKAVSPNQGFGFEFKLQSAPYGASDAEPSSIMAVSVIDQSVSKSSYPADPTNMPVAYVASPIRPQLISFGFDISFDSSNGFVGRDGRDDRLLTRTDLQPANDNVLDVRAVSAVPVNGASTDLAVVLGYTRLWIFNVTNPTAPVQYTSRSFEELGVNAGYARRMEVEGTLAYVIFNDAVAVFDFSDPEHPTRVATIDNLGRNLRWVAVKDGFIYTLSDDGLKVGIARATDQVVTYGVNPTAPGAGPGAREVCTNPVVINRATRKMEQPAGVFFQIFGHDQPASAQVIIRRETVDDSGARTEEILDTLPAAIDPQVKEGIVIGEARWKSSAAISNAPRTSYTAQVVLDVGTRNEYVSKHEPIPFSTLISEFQSSLGTTNGQGRYNYILGGKATVTLTVNGQNILADAADPFVRSYGLNIDSVKHDSALADGVYPFTLKATLEGSNPAVVDEVQGELHVANSPQDIRLPGNLAVNGVELSRGNLGVSYTDVEVRNRGLALTLARSYNTSGANVFGTFGYGWRHNLQVLLTYDKDRKSYGMSGGDGSGQEFKEAKLVGGRIKAEDPYQGTLVKNPDGSLDYFTKEHNKYHFPGALETDAVTFYNSAYMGNLEYIEEPNGNRLTLTFDAEGRMTRVTDSSGRALDFTYELAETPFVGTMSPSSANSISCTNKAQFSVLRSRFRKAAFGKAWRITNVAGPGGLALNYEYDADGNLQTVTRLGTDKLGSDPTQDSVWEYAYHTTTPAGVNAQVSHILKSVKSPNGAGHVTAYDYYFDQFRMPVKKVTFPEGVTNDYTYAVSQNKITRAAVTDGMGRATTYDFDGDGYATQVTGPRGDMTTMTWNKKGQKETETDPEGMTTTIGYDGFGNPNSYTILGTNKATGKQTLIQTYPHYDGTFAKVDYVRDGRGHGTTYVLDAKTGNVTSVRLPSNRNVTMSYFANGDLRSVTDEYGFITTFEYDAYGNQTRITRQTSGGAVEVTENTYDERSRLKTAKSTLGPEVTNTYDALDRVVATETRDPSGIRDSMTEKYTYFPGGEVKTETQEGGGQKFANVFEYDNLDRLRKRTETPNGAGPFVLDYTYDDNSNLKTETDRRGVTKKYKYDDLNFRTETAISGPFGPDLTVEQTTRDFVGNPTRVVNMHGHAVEFEYDGVHRLARRRLPGGFTEEMAYDENNNLTYFKDRNGRETVTSYDPVNRPSEQRKPLSHTVTWDYDDSTRTTTVVMEPQGLARVTRADGLDRPLVEEVRFGSVVYTTTYAYQGRSVEITDPRGVVTVKHLSAFGETGNVEVNNASPAWAIEMRYAAFGELKSMKDANGRETTYTVDGLNRTTAVSYRGSFNGASTFSESLAYDGEGNVISHTDRRGALSEMTYDNLGRRLTLRVHDSSGVIPVLTMEYDDARSTETLTDARNRKTVSEYDGLRRLVSVKNADLKTKTYVYDGLNLIEESDFRGAATRYVYDDLDRLSEIKDRSSVLVPKVTTIAHLDAGGHTQTITDRNGHERVESYDPLGRLTSVTHGGQPLLSYAYDGNSNRTQARDGRGNEVAYTYDALNRVKTVKHPGGLRTETYEYDAVGNVLSYFDGSGGAVTQTYDTLDLLLTRTDGEGNTTRFKFDGEGLLGEKLDPKGIQYKTAYEYNALRSLVKVTDALRGEWKFDYFPDQTLKSARDALSRLVTYEYDALKRQKTVTQHNTSGTTPLTLLTTYDYDENGNRTLVIDPKGQRTEVKYDKLDRPKTVTHSFYSGAGPREQSFEYDPEGNLTRAVETIPIPNGQFDREFKRTYDERNRLETATDCYDHTVLYGYDAANNLTRLKDAAGKETAYSYDPLNRVERTDLPGGPSINFNWRPDGLLEKVGYGNGMERRYAYDDADRLLSVTNNLGPQQVEEFAYTYDPNSNRATETKKFNAVAYRAASYNYDELDRLTKAEYGDGSGDPSRTRAVNYTYDAVGNRKTESGRDTTGAPLNLTYDYDDLNRLTAVKGYAGGDVSYTYDFNGNLLSAAQNGHYLASYEYDMRDQLRRVVDGAGQEVARYDYDFERKRLGRSVAGAELRYVYGGDRLLDEYDPAGNLVNRYDYGTDLVRSQLQGEGERWHFSDAQGSTTALSLVDTNGAPHVATRYEYDAFGVVVAGGGSANPFGYTGQRLDAETGLMPLGNGERYYVPAQGRFIQQDSWMGMMTAAQSLNRYAYAYGNPFRYTDPSGNTPQDSEGAANASLGFASGRSVFWGQLGGVLERERREREQEAGAANAHGIVEGPRNYLRDPLSPDHWVVNGLSNTLSDVLGLDNVAEWSWTIGDHRRPMSERVWAGVELVSHTIDMASMGVFVVGVGARAAGKVVAPLARAARAAGSAAKAVGSAAGKAVGKAVRLASSRARGAAGRAVERLASSRAGRAVGDALGRAWQRANAPISQLFKHGADDAARALSMSDDAARAASLSDDAARSVDDFMDAARTRMNETRARYGFNEASDKIVGMDNAASAAGAGGAGKPKLKVALGISSNGELAAFAKERGATTYVEYWKTQSFQEKPFYHLMNIADEIHFNIGGNWKWEEYVSWALHDGKLSFKNGSSTVANWELREVLANPDWRKKLIF